MKRTLVFSIVFFLVVSLGGFATVHAADLTISDIMTTNGNWTLNGAMTANSFSSTGSGFSGNGSGLTNVPAASLSCTSCVSASQLNFTPGTVTSITAGTGLSGGTITGSGTISLDFATVAKKYSRVAVVAKSGGDYMDPVVAINSLGTWCTDGGPSPDKPCLLKIMPGTYDIGTNNVGMQSYVDIEGSGENTTIITGGNGNSTVGCAPNAEIRSLTVKNTASVAIGCANTVGFGTFKISNVTAMVSATSGALMAIMNASADVSLLNVTASVTGGTENMSVHNDNSKVTMMNVTATASGGTNNNGVMNSGNSTVQMTNVTAAASGGSSNVGISNNGGSNVTMNNIGASADGIACAYNANCYNAGIDNYLSTVVMTAVKGSASGGSSSSGINNNSDSNSLVTMTNVEATASGASGGNYGINNLSQSSTSTPVMKFVIASAVGDGTPNSNSVGVSNDNANTTMFGVTATASGGVFNDGVFNNASLPKMTNVRAEAFGGQNSSGIHNMNCSAGFGMGFVNAQAHDAATLNAAINNQSCSPTMINVSASVSSGAVAFNCAILNNDSSPSIQSSFVSAPRTDTMCGYGCVGVGINGSGTVSIDNSQIYAYNVAVDVEDTASAYIGNSKLVGISGGSPHNGGTGQLKCLGVYDGTLTSLSDICQY